MEKPKTTAKDFFYWAGAIVSFYWTIIATVFLIFDYINYALPDALAYYPANPYQSGMPYEMASIIVLLPVYLLLMSLIRADIARDPSRKELWVRRWAIIFTLFIAGITIAVDLITLLTSFLSGDALTLAFLLKVLVVFVLAVKIFAYFILDLKGYWDSHRSHRMLVIGGTIVAAVVIVVAGFFVVGTPAQARLERFDVQKVSDLQNIQQQIGSYYQAKQKLPVATSDLASLPYYSYSAVPVDPQTGVAYEYQVTGKLSYSLCTTFNGESTLSQLKNSQISEPAGYSSDSWKHASGYVCFERVIDPAFYPPLNKI